MIAFKVLSLKCALSRNEKCLMIVATWSQWASQVFGRGERCCVKPNVQGVARQVAQRENP